MPGWVSQLVILVLISVQVMISGLWDQALHWAPCSAGSLLEILSPFPSLSFSLNKINKIFKKKIGTPFSHSLNAKSEVRNFFFLKSVMVLAQTSEMIRSVIWRVSVAPSIMEGISQWIKGQRPVMCLEILSRRGIRGSVNQDVFMGNGGRTSYPKTVGNQGSW